MQMVELSTSVDQEFLRYFRCPETFAAFEVEERVSDGNAGYFRFGPELICYGRVGEETQERPHGALRDVLPQVREAGQATILPFDPQEVATNLRRERYVRREKPSLSQRAIRQVYYLLRPALPVQVRRHLQRHSLQGWATKPFPHWPVDTTVDRLFAQLMRLKLQSSSMQRVPFIWFWPEGRQSCAIMTHDVETAAGVAFSSELMDINDAHGIKSSFQLIPDARYTVTAETIRMFRDRGFEVNVHDLKHDGHLFDDAAQFRASAARINAFGRSFGSRGFRSGALYRNQEWYGALDFDYDMSVPNCAHLDPQHGGCCTVMPYFVDDILELPVTATQDYSLFHVIGTYSMDLWRQQIEAILQQHGIASFIVHPDYLDRPEAKDCYNALLSYLSDLRSTEDLWTALPGEVNDWWRARDAMQLVPTAGEGWKIAGAGAERARVAYASLQDDVLAYTFA